MSLFETFERLIVRKEAGYVCDEAAMVKLTNLASFDTAVFKLTTKIETSLLLMSSHTGVEMFTIDVVPLRSHNQGKSLSRDEALYNSWDKLEARGCHGLLTLAHVDTTSMPNNGSRVKYSLAQFVDSLLHGVEAYFMFQKFSPLFTLNAAGLWDAVENTKMETCFLVLAWRLSEEPRAAPLVPRLPLTQRNTVAVTHSQAYIKPRTPIVTPVATPVIESRKRDPPTPEESQAPPAKRRGRPIRQSKVIKPVVRQESSEEEQEEEEDEEDEEVTFKVQPPPVKIPEVVYSPCMTPPKPPTPTVTPPAPVVNAPEESIGDVTFGFESSGPKTTGRKSTGGRKSMGGRKSLLPGWPEDEKDSVLTFFDHINPKQTEQARIALACKYGTMKYDRELPSKQLYQWVQRKGRVPDTPAPGTSYDLPEAERTNAAVTLFRSLKPEHSEASRISFTCRFFQTQYEMELTSKQLYNMLEGKKTKATGRGRR